MSGLRPTRDEHVARSCRKPDRPSIGDGIADLTTRPQRPMDSDGPDRTHTDRAPAPSHGDGPALDAEWARVGQALRLAALAVWAGCSRST